MNQITRKLQIPNEWDRKGLPAWAYHSAELLGMEREEVFLNHWQVAGHVSDIPAPGDWLTFDILGERGLVMRGRDGVVRAFHNLCRHRGARVVDGASGHCRGALVCPFHGWVYNLDGSLRGAARPDSFGEMDKADFGLMPIELDIWRGFLFLRFHPGPQPGVAELFAPFEADFAAYRTEDYLPLGAATWETELEVNWKSVRDVDNEGYHVAMAHPALQDLYGKTYIDQHYTNGVSHSHAKLGEGPGRFWSVRQYRRHTTAPHPLPERLDRAWTYYGLFPNNVFAMTPEGGQFYQDIPLGTGKTLLRGRLYRYGNESRRQRLARYLAQRIDNVTSAEDRQLSIWSNEAMKSAAFEGFHLSDLEFGLKNHHDQLRGLLPVLRLDEAPAEGTIREANAALKIARLQQQGK